jgi:tRNA(Ile)-lysidine synthase
VAGRRESFSPQWLDAHLAELIANYPDVSLCVALSGGVDSTALLAALSMLKRVSVRAIHVNHGLHANAGVWSEHCRKLAQQLHVPFRVVAVTVDRSRGTSLEAEARDARYAAFAEELTDGEVLLTGHHEDDQLETVLLQLLRGAGLAGLAAMPASTRFANGWHVRPLLEASREQLVAWVRERSLTWVEDDTNADERLDRNYLRRAVLPALQARWPSASRTVARSARHIAEGQSLLEALARADVERASFGASLSAKVLRTFTPERRRNAVRFWIAQSGHPLPDTTRLEEIIGPLLNARADANPRVTWQDSELTREWDLLTLRKAQANAASDSQHLLVWRVRSQPMIELPGDCGRLELQSAARGPIDADALPSELSIHWRSGGERLRPRRNGPSKSLKSLLQSTRVPLAERARVPLLFDADHLVAVGDLWSDASIQADEDAKHRARFVWHRYPSAD